MGVALPLWEKGGQGGFFYGNLICWLTEKMKNFNSGQWPIKLQLINPSTYQQNRAVDKNGI
jgi:hypothetical protein